MILNIPHAHLNTDFYWPKCYKCDDANSEYMLPWICQPQSWSKWRGTTKPAKRWHSVTQCVLPVRLCKRQVQLLLQLKMLHIFSFQWIIQITRFTLTSGTVYKSCNVSADSIAMFRSFPERNTLHRPAVAYLIMFIQCYQMQCINVLVHSVSLSVLCLSYMETVALTTIMHLKSSLL